MLALFLFANDPPSYADLILLNGKLVTVDKNFTIAEAVAIKKDKIIAVGSNEEIRKLANRETKIIDLYEQISLNEYISLFDQLDFAYARKFKRLPNRLVYRIGDICHPDCSCSAHPTAVF